MKDVRKVCQLMERCDDHGRSVQELRDVTVVQKCNMQPSGRCERY